MSLNTSFQRLNTMPDAVFGQFAGRLASQFATPEWSGQTMRIGARFGETLRDLVNRAGLAMEMPDSSDVSMPLNARLLPGEIVTFSIDSISVNAVNVEYHPLANEQTAPSLGLKDANPLLQVDWRINLQANRSPQAYSENSLGSTAKQDFGRGLQALSDYLGLDGYRLSGSLEVDGHTVPVNY